MQKMLVRLTLAGACSAIGLGTAAAMPIVNVRVPFAFTVEGVQLPAGRYTVEPFGEDAATLAIRDAHERVATIVLTGSDAPVQPNDTSSLTFVKGEHGYELRSVHADGGRGWALPR